MGSPAGPLTHVCALPGHARIPSLLAPPPSGLLAAHRRQGPGQGEGANTGSSLTHRGRGGPRGGRPLIGRPAGPEAGSAGSTGAGAGAGRRVPAGSAAARAPHPFPRRPGPPWAVAEAWPPREYAVSSRRAAQGPALSPGDCSPARLHICGSRPSSGLGGGFGLALKELPLLHVHQTFMDHPPSLHSRGLQSIWLNHFGSQCEESTERRPALAATRINWGAFKISVPGSHLQIDARWLFLMGSG
ncbi:collagen, type I, alpha 1a-like [Pongo pygmaeus]|uniref:collagen, type I, alpha 1a-like n=1 Tax=Pongo pygmaeus TaxID=9600 RepID=UPI00300D1F61